MRDPRKRHGRTVTLAEAMPDWIKQGVIRNTGRSIEDWNRLYAKRRAEAIGHRFRLYTKYEIDRATRYFGLLHDEVELVELPPNDIEAPADPDHREKAREYNEYCRRMESTPVDQRPRFAFRIRWPEPQPAPPTRTAADRPIREPDREHRLSTKAAADARIS